MNGDEASGDCQPDETTVRLQTGLRSCRVLVDTYRAMLSGELRAVGHVTLSAESDPPKEEHPA